MFFFQNQKFAHYSESKIICKGIWPSWGIIGSLNSDKRTDLPLNQQFFIYNNSTLYSRHDRSVFSLRIWKVGLAVQLDYCPEEQFSIFDH